MMNNQDQMHPDDKRNMIIMFVLAAIIWVSYDSFYLQPRREAAQAAQQKAQEQAQEAAIADGVHLPGASGSVQNIRPRDEVVAESARLKIDNGQIFGSLSLEGGRIDDIALHEYYETLDKKNNVVLLSPAGTQHPRYAEWGWIAADSKTAVPDKNSRWRVAEGDLSSGVKPDEIVTLFWENGAGLRFERDISVDDNVLITVKQRVINHSDKDVQLYPYSLLSQKGLPEDLFGRYIIHEGPIGYADGELTELSYKKIRKHPATEVKAAEGWIGITERYWFTGIIPMQGEETTFRYLYTVPQNAMDRERYQTDAMGSARMIAPGQTAEVQNRLFVGPKKLSNLDFYEKDLSLPHFDLVMDFGMYYFLTKPYFYILHFFYNLTANMGIAIVMMTILVRAAVFPLANTSFRSFAALRKISPQMQEIREKYNDDKQKLQEALVKLYETEKVNPMAGCFPMLIQIPIFFALYKVLQISIEIRHAPFYGWVKDMSVQDPTTVFNLFGLIPWNPPSFLMIGAWPCLMLLFMLLQRQMNPPPQDKTQAMMINFMPFMMTFVMAKFAAGLVIYWTISSALSIVQQYIIMRGMGVEVHFLRSKEDKEMAKEVAEGPAVHPAIEMIEEDVEEALFGDDKDAADKNHVSKPKPKKKKKK